MAKKRTAKPIAKTKPMGKRPVPARNRPTWEERCQELRRFKREHGHCNVPHGYAPNPALGDWVGRARMRYKNGELNEEQVRALNLLGFEWVLLAKWEDRFGELKAFRKEHGHCDVPIRYRPNHQLGRWVNNQRQRKKHGELPQDRVRLLNALGFSWKMRGQRAAVPWEIRLKELKRFKKAHGHCNVPQRCKSAPSLGSWVSGVRQLKNRGVLADERVRILDALGFRWAQPKKPKPKKKRG